MRFYTRTILIFTVTILLIGFIGRLNLIYAEPNKPVSITDQLTDLVNHHPLTLAANERLKAAKARSKYRGWYYPDPELSYMYVDAPYKKDPARLSKKSFPETELEINQPIPTPGRLSIESKIFDIEAEQARLAFRAESNKIATNYLNDLAEFEKSKHHYELTKQYRIRFAPILSISGAQYALGKGDLSDISIARLSSRDLEVKEKKYQRIKESEEQNLTYYNQNSTKDLPSFEELQNYSNELLARLITETRPMTDISIELGLAALNTQIAEKQSTVNKLAYVPDFSIFAKYNRVKRSSPDPLDESTWFMPKPDNRISLGFTMRVPLWSALNNHNNIEEANRSQDAAKYDYQELSRSAEVARSSLLIEIESAKERLSLIRSRMIPEASRAVIAAREGYQSGRSDFGALLQVWESLYSLEMEAVEIETEQLQKTFELARLLNKILP
ncbi:MAG: TolC family protein [Leptonema sp. (in: Bacteria)]|nr:TolC family protein [Leptonema sp. (in: bacteria)]